MSTDNQNLTLYAGDDAVLNFTVVDESGNPLQLGAATFSYVIAPNEGGMALVTKTLANGITVTNAAGGLLSVAISHADTPAFLGAMWHQLVMTDGLGNVSTLMTGTPTFKARS